MELKYIITLAAFIVPFLSAYIWMSYIARHISDFDPPFFYQKDTFLPIWASSLFGISVVYFFLPVHYDIVFPISFWNVIAAFLGASAIYAISLYAKTAKLVAPVIFIAAFAGLFFIPSDFLLFEGVLPFFLDRFCILLIWGGIGFCWKYFNGIDGVLGLENASLYIGICLLGILGGISTLVGNFGFAFLGVAAAFLIFNWYPARIILKPGGAQAWGFLTAWLLLQGSQEGSSSCILIFLLYPLVEMLWAVGLKLSLRPRYKNLVSNMNYYQANVAGLAPNLVCSMIIRLQFILLLFGCFQLYAPNAVSLPILSLIISVWFINRIKNWQEEPQTLKELNHNFIRDIKDNVEDVKKQIKKEK